MSAGSNLAWWEGTKGLGSQPGLEAVVSLLDMLGEPQSSYRSIHVTGTNGKGSTAAMTATILREAGFRVGLFTSPHLSRWNESIVVDGEEITDSEMEAILGVIRDFVDESKSRHPTHFEVLTVAAFQYFRERDVELAVVEVGMGGRDDATNVIPSGVSVVTNVSLEHTQWLGGTVDEIARNKSGILREGTALITASIDDAVLKVLDEATTRQDSSLIRVGVDYIPIPTQIDLSGQRFHLVTPGEQLRDLEIPLLGTHQLLNAGCAVAAVQSLQDLVISEEAIRKGLRKMVWPGRFEIVERNPLIILDGAKDLGAAKRLKETVMTYLPGVDVFTVLSTSSDKDIKGMVNQLADVTGRFIITEHRIKSRTATSEQLVEVVEPTGVPFEVVVPVHESIMKAKEVALEGDAILITGSVFLVGEAREYWYPLLK